MMHKSPNYKDLVNIDVHIKLVKICPLVLKILSGNNLNYRPPKDGTTEGQGKSGIAPLFQSLLYNDYARVLTHFSHYKSMEIFLDAQGQLTPQSLVGSG